MRGDVQEKVKGDDGEESAQEEVRDALAVSEVPEFPDVTVLAGLVSIPARVHGGGVRTKPKKRGGRNRTDKDAARVAIPAE
jgi:hypothetical protein